MSANSQVLVDKFGRTVNYVRLSITDRCDLRCVYCMSEDMQFLPRKQILSLEEIAKLGQTFVGLGVNKIRLTGGEPLVRHNIIWLVNQLGALQNQGLRELTMTTNGMRLEKLAKSLKRAGLARINVSLDSLKAARFEKITRVGKLEQVLKGIEAAKKQDFARIKINAVIMRNHNEDEVLDLVDYALANELDISFIEEMPLGEIEYNRHSTYYSSDEIKQDIEQKYSLFTTTETTGGPSKYYRIAGHNSRIGFISPHSHNFCESCNRVRVTVQGRLLLCLGQEHSVDLKQVMRSYPDDSEKLKQTIVQAMDIKPKGHDFDLSRQVVLFRHMSATGG